MPRPNNSNKPPKSFSQRAHPGGGGPVGGPGGPGAAGAGPTPDPSSADAPLADGTPAKKSDPTRNRFKKRPGKR